MQRRGAALVIVVACLCGNAALAEDLLHRARALFGRLPASLSNGSRPSPERVALGRKLFFEPRVSIDGTTSCARCHQPALYGTDALPKGIGVQNRSSPRNVPTVLNAAAQLSQHWIGDRASVEDQAKKALL